jgi:ribosomal protein S18 acetylase RimI-like enzyme
MTISLLLVIVLGALSIAYGVVTARQVMALDAGSVRMQEISRAVQEGASAYLRRQYTTISIVGAVLFVLPGSRYAELARPGEGEFRMLAVDPAAQGRGVGRELVLACLDRAAAAGCSAVVISVRDTAAAAQRLYTRLGFRRMPQVDHSPLPDVHLLGMRYELPVREDAAIVW